jgi:hypothetical protein
MKNILLLTNITRSKGSGFASLGVRRSIESALKKSLGIFALVEGSALIYLSFQKTE